jgi:undecaprenyl-diphosphatase
MPLKRFISVLLPSLVIVLLLVLFLKTEFPVARLCTPCTMIQDLCNPYCPANDPSFPSGHAATIFTAITALWLVQRKRWQLPVFLIAIAVAASRVFLGVHTWFDVTMGGLIGLAVTILVWRELERHSFLAEKR